MGWKNFPSWLKGGLIGLIVELVGIIILSSRKCNNTEVVGGGWCAWGFGFIFENFYNIFTEDLIVIVIFTGFLVLGFLIGATLGAVIGLIAGIFRKRNLSNLS